MCYRPEATFEFASSDLNIDCSVSVGHAAGETFVGWKVTYRLPN